MRNKEDIQELLTYFQSLENRALQFNEVAIVAAYQKDDNHQSLAIKILSVFGGQFASLAFLGFLFITGLYDSGIGMTVFGIISVLGSVLVNRLYDRIVIETLSVSFFINGFMLLGFGLDALKMSDSFICVIFIGLALLSLFIVQNSIFSFISVLIINGSILVLVSLSGNFYISQAFICCLALMVTVVFLKEAKALSMNEAISKLYRPVRLAFVVSLLFVLLYPVVYNSVPEPAGYTWIPTVVIIAAIVYLMRYVLEILSVTKLQTRIIIYFFSAVLLVPTAFYPAIAGSLLIILLSFLVNDKTGFVAGILVFLYAISLFYYDLGFTLLTKSILLFLSGILFIGLYLFTQRKLTSHEKV